MPRKFFAQRTVFRGFGIQGFPLAFAGIVLGLSGCGFFEPPYEIRNASPPEGTSARDALPEAEGMAELDRPPLRAIVIDAAEDYAFCQYEGDVTFGALRFRSSGVAVDALDQLHEEYDASSRTKVSVGNYSWAEARNPRYRFLWTNGPWLFLVEAPSKSSAEPVLFSSEYVERIETEE